MDGNAYLNIKLISYKFEPILYLIIKQVALNVTIKSNQ